MYMLLARLRRRIIMLCSGRIQRYYIVPVTLLCLSGYIFFTSPEVLNKEQIQISLAPYDDTEYVANPIRVKKKEDVWAESFDPGKEITPPPKKTTVNAQPTGRITTVSTTKVPEIPNVIPSTRKKNVHDTRSKGASQRTPGRKQDTRVNVTNEDSSDSSIIGVSVSMQELLLKIRDTDPVNGILYKPPVKPNKDWAFNITECPKDPLNNPILMKRSLQHLINTDYHLKLSINGTGPVNKYMSSYRNPCWLESLPNENYKYPPSFIRDRIWKDGDKRVRERHSELEETYRRRQSGGPGWRTRCLPYVYMAGIYKSGTTDFYYNLVKHPMFAVTPPKEPFFWRYLNDRLRQDLTEQQNFQGWLDVYDIPAEEIRQDKDAMDNHQKITLDASTWTWRGHLAWRDHPWNQKTQKQCIKLPQHIKYLTPDAKIIFLLRNPVSWMKSCYNHFQNAMWGSKRFPPSQQDLHEKIIKGIKWFNQCVNDTNDPDYCINIDYVGVYECHAKFTLYYFSVKSWVDTFGLENVLVVPSESYYEDRLKSLNDVLKFLKLPPYPETIANDIVTKQSITTEHHGTLIPGLLNSTAQLLTEFTKPWNKKLADLLHDDRFLWES